LPVVWPQGTHPFSSTFAFRRPRGGATSPFLGPRDCPAMSSNSTIWDFFRTSQAGDGAHGAPRGYYRKAASDKAVLTMLCEVCAQWRKRSARCRSYCQPVVVLRMRLLDKYQEAAQSKHRTRDERQPPPSLRDSPKSLDGRLGNRRRTIMLVAWTWHLARRITIAIKAEPMSRY
jgi:hypothetical protein